MAVKKKRVIRKRAKPSARTSRRNVRSRGDDGKLFSNVKLGLVVKNLILFTLLFLLSYVLSVIISGVVLSNLFYFLWIIFAFIALAFFIALLVLLLLKWMRR